MISTLNKAALANSTKCIDVIWNQLDMLYDDSDFNGRNFFHQHIISLGKAQFIREEQIVPGEVTNRLIGGDNGPDNSNKTTTLLDYFTFSTN